MTAEDDFKDILLPDETVLWSGAPHWPASKRKADWRNKIEILLWLAGTAVALAIVVAYGDRVPEGVFYRPLLQTAGVVLIIVAAFLFFGLFNGAKSPARQKERYAITTQRLVILDEDEGQRLSVLPGSIHYLVLEKNGGTHDLWFYLSNDEDDHRVLYALTDGAIAEKLLLERFARRKADP